VIGGFALFADMGRAKLAVTLDHPEHNGLASAALRSRRALVRVFVAFLAADERRIRLNGPFERGVERIRAGRMTKTVKDKPSGLLRDLQILRERG